MVNNDRRFWESVAGALDLVGVELMNGDPLYVRLVPLMPARTSARRWVDGWNASMSVLASRWLTVPGPAAKYLRAVPEELEDVLGSASSSFFVLASRGHVARWRGATSVPPLRRAVEEPLVAPWDVRWPDSGPPYVVIPRAPPIGNRFDKVPSRLREVAIFAYLSDEVPRMLAAAAELEAASYPKVGDFVRERALQINTLRVAAVGGRAYRIRDDWEEPSGLALWFVGDRQRWRELLAANPALRVETGWRPEDQAVRPWRKGLAIVLPAGWEEHRVAQRAVSA